MGMISCPYAALYSIPGQEINFNSFMDIMSDLDEEHIVEFAMFLNKCFQTKKVFTDSNILYISTTWERPSRRDGPPRRSSAPRSSAPVLGKAYAVDDIVRRIPLRSNGALLV